MKRSSSAISILSVIAMINATGCYSSKGSADGGITVIDQALHKHETIAVVVVDNDRRLQPFQGALIEVQDEIISALLNKGYDVAERSQLAKVLDELKFGESVLTENDLSRIGKVADADAILFVNVVKAKVATPTARHGFNSVGPILTSPILQIGQVGSNVREARVKLTGRIVALDTAEVMLAAWGEGTAPVYERDELGNAHTTAVEKLAETIPEKETPFVSTAITGDAE